EQALPMINDYHTYTNELASYPNNIAFPENGLHRLHFLKEKLLPLQSELSFLQKNKMNDENKYNDWKKSLVEQNIYEEALKIASKKTIYLEQKQELKKHYKVINQLTTEINKELNELNIGLTQADLASI